MDRIEKALHLIDRNGLGLEIGPSHRPLAPKKAGFNVEILDHATAEQLRKKYQGHNLNIDNIEEVDYVWQGEPLDELVGKTGAYDYIIASHVIEHTTDLIGFLQQCSKLLKLNGVLSLIIPDKRYCFDYLRPISTSGDCIQAHFEKRSRHNVGVIFDYFSSVCSRNGVGVWDENSNQGELKFIHTFDEAAHFIEMAKDTNADYIDVHQWRFTPASFNLVLNDLQKLNLVDLYELKSFDTNGCEFHITLSKNPVAPSDRLELYKTTLGELSATNFLQPKGEQGNQLQGYLDTVVIESDCLKLSGWAANIDGEPAFELKVIVDDCEMPLWELRRVIRKNIPKVIENASPLCGFELFVPLVSLPKLAKALSVVAKNSSAECGNVLLTGSGAGIDWEYILSLQNVAPSWSKRHNANSEKQLD